MLWIENLGSDDDWNQSQESIKIFIQILHLITTTGSTRNIWSQRTEDDEYHPEGQRNYWYLGGEYGPYWIRIWDEQ